MNRIMLLSTWVTLLCAAAGPSSAQFQPPTVFDGAQAASWIAHPDAPGDEFGVYHLRREFRLEAVPDEFIVHVSADNRYRLYLNGEQISSGPQRSDLMHWRYETVDLAPQLRAGDNVLSALVWNWGAERPVAQFSRQTAFLLQGNSPAEAELNSGPGWAIYRNPGYAPLPVDGDEVGGYYASAPGEALDTGPWPWGWMDADFDAGGWPQAQAVANFRMRMTQLRGNNPFGEAGGWQLQPRSIPPMEERPVRFASIRRSEGISADEGFLQRSRDLVVPPQTNAVLLLDHGHLTNAFAVLETSGGAGAELSLIYAEALKDAEGNKGNRNEVGGKSISGVRDEFRLAGGDRRRLQTLWFRTYRYVQLQIQTQDEPLTIHDLHGIFVAYPFELQASFDSELPWIDDMWEINWRGMRLNAWETYVDTPYYEQLQYVGDTRIQALITMYMSDDDRLVRQAIEHFDVSRIPEGITASRYPSAFDQYIPTFSLIWVAMVHDFWMHRDDPDYVRSFLPGIRSVLSWYERHIDETGMTGPLPWWPFVDWAPEWPRGVPPGGTTGQSTVISLQLAYALERAAALEAELGIAGNADHYRALADSVRTAVRERAWDETRGLFADTPASETFSQQANVLAILTDTVAEADKPALMQRLLADASLTQSTYYFSFYQLEALRDSGLADNYIEQLAPWQDMLALGLTTVPETPEPTRSDSHAWSAHPNYGLLATVLGVRPAEPGFRSVQITPQLGALEQAAGRIPHPLGNIDVELRRTRRGGLDATISLPEGLSGTILWNGAEQHLEPGRQRLEL